MPGGVGGDLLVALTAPIPITRISFCLTAYRREDASEHPKDRQIEYKREKQ